MPIVFSPVKARRQEGKFDLTISARGYRSGCLAMELSLSTGVQDRVRYVDGDRVIVVFDESQKTLVVERVGGDTPGYKVCVKKLQNSREAVRVRVGCTKQHWAQVLGDARSKKYELFEINGNKVTFVESA